MSRKIINYKDLVLGINGEWGSGFDDEKDAEKFRKNPPDEKIKLGALLSITQLLQESLKLQVKMLQENREFYEEMMKEQRVLKNLRK